MKDFCLASWPMMDGGNGVIFFVCFWAVGGELSKVRGKADANDGRVYEEIITDESKDIITKMNDFASNAKAHFASRNTPD